MSLSPTQIQRLIVYLIAIVTCAFAAATFVVNAHDNQMYINTTQRFWAGLYNGVELQNPPHSYIFLTPFVLFGERTAAFWNLLPIMLLFIHWQTDLKRDSAKLLMLLTPPLLYVSASANISGVVAAGLLLLLARQRGIVRGLAWVMLTIRPQDTLTLLVVEGVLALYQRDWKAFLIAAIIGFFPAIFYPQIFVVWFVDLATSTRNGDYSLSITPNQGLLAALGFLALIVSLRAVEWRDGRLALRRWRDVSLLERWWGCLLIQMIAGPYTSYYAIWMLLIPLRHYGLWRTLLIFVLQMGIGLAFMTQADPAVQQIGFLISIVVVALIAPRREPQYADAPLEAPNVASAAA